MNCAPSSGRQPLKFRSRPMRIRHSGLFFGDIYDWAGQDRDPFIDRLTYYLGEVNAVHPFREGNGRTQRAFFGQLADDAGFPLDWQDLDADRNIAASMAIMRGDPEPMRKLSSLCRGSFYRREDGRG
jgi:fido (protein-threonine AMPylation protein)